ncbi:MAG: hypothetical protein FJY56_04480 [Betaproteobacteria bacterium]|nr:hypothetical protein [Betaproteobacteria bacterium]
MAAAPITMSFAGSWLTTFGQMTLEQSGNGVRGVYHYGNVEGRIEGTVDHSHTLRFRYQEPQEQGEGTFRLQRAGRFAGSYTPAGDTRARAWVGERGWDGIWETEFGRMRLLHEADRVHGSYEGAGPSLIEGSVKGGRLEFCYREPRAQGEGWFEQYDEGYLFAGEWRAQGVAQARSWRGRRVQAERGITWLLVLEAHWQRSLAESEYAFGHMLREVFARLPQVRVRQRFFHDADSLDHWCRELAYIPEPAILMVASHGVAEGLSVHGEVIDTTRVLNAVRDAGNLKLLHFSSCLVGLDGQRALNKQPFAVSGYTTSVDWGASALLEFTYLDLLLNRGLEPAQAAAALPKLVSYCGDLVHAECPYPAAGFRFFSAASG